MGHECVRVSIVRLILFFPDDPEVIDVDVSQDESTQRSDADSQWVTEDWFAGEADAPPPPPPPTAIDEQQLRTIINKFNVQNLAAVICPICLDETPTQDVIVGCGHTVCRKCRHHANLRVCPDCRHPITSTVVVNTGAMRMAWKEDLASNFATDSIEANEAMNGRRPGDTTIAEDLMRESEALARRLEAGGDEDEG